MKKFSKVKRVNVIKQIDPFQKSENESGTVALEQDSSKQWKIKPIRKGVLAQFSEVWAHRNLYIFLGTFTTGHIYRQAILGIGWLIIQPLVLALSSVFVFGEMFKVSTKPIPLPLYVIYGLAFWFMFRRCIQWMTKNLAMWRGILSRFYVPPLMLLMATLFPVLLEFSVILIVALIATVYFGFIDGSYIIPFGWQILVTIPALTMSFFLALSIGCVTTILNTMARDTWLTMRYVLNVWMILTPVLYPLHAIPQQYREWMLLNPLVPILELYRWGIFHQGEIHWDYLLITNLEIIFLLTVGLYFFAWKQKKLLGYH